MNSTFQMKCLLVAYLVIMITSFVESNYPRALYWLSASMLTMSILWGFK